MYDMFRVLMMGIFTTILTLALTPLVRLLAFKVGATDKPDKRRVNKTIMPTMGGIAIYLSFFIATFFLQPIALSVSVLYLLPPLSSLLPELLMILKN